MIYYDAEPTPATEPVTLPAPWDDPGEAERDMRHYRPDQGLQHAVNAALLLRRPLLLTGEPGTGKTELAAHLAWKLGWGRALRFDTKSTSQARDLFYTYDALGHFRAVQLRGVQPQKHWEEKGDSDKTSARALDFITLNPLGLAILLSLEEAELTRRGLNELLNTSLQSHGLVYGGPRCSVVLIDEIDKAARDFPNDILNELEDLSFRIPEISEDTTPIRATPRLRPVVVITSNSEKHLPDPFLRRCVYYNIPFPDQAIMRDLIQRQNKADLGEMLNHSAFFGDALNLFYALRHERIRKKPSTAELLAWLYRLRHEFKAELAGEKPFADAAHPLAAMWREPQQAPRVTKDLGILLKVKEDLEVEMPKLLSNWARGQGAEDG